MLHIRYNLVASLIASMLVMYRPALAEVPMAMTERYIVAIPSAYSRNQGRLQLYVTAPRRTTVRIRSLWGDSVTRTDRIVVVGQTTHDNLVWQSSPPTPTAPGRIGMASFELFSDGPVQVVAMFGVDGNGEGTHYLPVHAWGTEYRSFNWSTDRFGPSASPSLAPNQIVVTARDDSTVVRITPRRDLVGGPDLPSIKAGETDSVMLQAGQTIYLEDIVDTLTVAKPESDLTGSRITSDKPIAVLSGGTKVAVTRMPAVLPLTGPDQVSADFVRNNVNEMMLPTSMADTLFVVGGRPSGLHRTEYVPPAIGPDRGVDSTAGSVVRLMAIENGTVVTRQESGWSQPVQVAVLDAGATYTDSVVVGASIVRASKPALCVQYEKSWTELGDGVPVTPITGGRPTMQVVPSVGQWMRQAVRMPSVKLGLTIVVRTEDVAGLRYQNQPLTWWPWEWADTVGEYSIIRLPDAKGAVISHEQERPWMAWAHVTDEDLTWGYAFASPVAIELPAGPVPTDSLVVLRDTLYDDGRWEADMKIIDRASGATVFRTGELGARTNMTCTLERDDSGIFHARGRVLVGSRKGSAGVWLYSDQGLPWFVSTDWQPDVIKWSPTGRWDFSYKHVRDTMCRRRTLLNTSARTVTITSIEPTEPGYTMTITPPLPIVLEPETPTDVQICIQATAEVHAIIGGHLVLHTSGYILDSLPFDAEFYVPHVECEDHDFGSPPVAQRQRITMSIVNIASTPLRIYGIDRSELDASAIFRLDSGLATFPIVLPPFYREKFVVTADPSMVMQETTVRIPVLSDAIGMDTVIELRIGGTATSVAGDAVVAAVNVTPNPVGLDGRVRIPCHHRARLSMTDLEGRTLWSGEADVDDPVMPVTSLGIHSAGRYVLTIEEVGRVAVHLPIVVL